MVVGELLGIDQQREPGEGRFLRAGLRRRVPGRGRGTIRDESRKPSRAAGFFVAPRPAPGVFADQRRELWNFVRAKLWRAVPLAACLCLTACSCLSPATRPVSIRRAPGFAMPSTDLEADVNLTVLTYNVYGLPTWMNHEPKARYTGIASGLERLHPDVVLLQEVWTKSATAVAPTNACWQVAQASSANFFHRNGLMVLSRLPIVGGEFHAFDKAAFPDSMVRKGALKVTALAPGGQRLNIWNVHLQCD